MDPENVPDWLRPPPRKRAIICDLDDTLCYCFDQPILPASEFLAALDRDIQVHYVTARPEASRAGTEAFLLEHRLPGWRNLHFCPGYLSSRDHKREVMARLARQYRVVVSVGDHDEDEMASREANIPFVRITPENVEQAWHEVAQLVYASST